MERLLGDGRVPDGGCGVGDVSRSGGGFLSGSIWTEKVEVMGAFLLDKAGLWVPSKSFALLPEIPPRPEPRTSLVYPVTRVSYWQLPRARRQEIFL